MERLWDQTNGNRGWVVGEGGEWGMGDRFWTEPLAFGRGVQCGDYWTKPLEMEVGKFKGGKATPGLNHWQLKGGLWRLWDQTTGKGGLDQTTGNRGGGKRFRLNHWKQGLTSSRGREEDASWTKPLEIMGVGEG